MPKRKVKSAKVNNLLEFMEYLPDEKGCREMLATARWHGKPVCVKCGSTRKVYKINEGKLLKCADCRKQFTVRIGTIFEDSALPLRTWYAAIYLIMAHKKSISSIQMAKHLGVTQKTAWFMNHRIRHAIRTRSFEKLTGIVEIDETAIGGRTVGQGTGFSQPNKTVVFGMKQRDGEVRAQTITRMTGEALKPIIRNHVSKDAILMTDEFGAYYGLNKEFKEHHTVNHGAKEYVRGKVHTNSIESFWALFKRIYHGTFHWVSGKHLDAYIDETEFRLNTKHLSDPSRFQAMLAQCDSRLTYKNLIAE